MKTVKSGDPVGDVVLRSMVTLNQHNVSVEYGIFGEVYLISKVHPVGLILPNGWHFSKGAFRKEDSDSDGCIPCFKPSGHLWQGVTA